MQVRFLKSEYANKIKSLWSNILSITTVGGDYSLHVPRDLLQHAGTDCKCCNTLTVQLQPAGAEYQASL